MEVDERMPEIREQFLGYYQFNQDVSKEVKKPYEVKNFQHLRASFYSFNNSKKGSVSSHGKWSDIMKSSKRGSYSDISLQSKTIDHHNEQQSLNSKSIYNPNIFTEDSSIDQGD
mmetsp:Transcript_5814/g.4993  ORF Transcript_5814/g.4993 Transcript_5814/m.4993 type:complete len:114 (+) Transcript_5814:537-878(+)